MRSKLLTTIAIGVACTGTALAQHNSSVWAETVHRDFTAYLEAHPEATYSPSTMLVRFESDKSEAYKANVRALVGDGWLEKYTIVPGLELIHVSGSIMDAVARVKPFVMYAEPDYAIHIVSTPNDPSFGLEFGLKNTGQTVNGDPGTAGADIRATQAWDVFTGDPNFVIADIDTGLQLNHPDFAGNVWVNPGEIPANGIDDDSDGYIDDVNGWNFYDNNSNPSDLNGHGTHTAGTIGARGNNGIGVSGVNWQCKIMPIRAFSPSGGGSVSICVSCIQFAVLKGTKVSSNSWGSPTFNVQSLSDAIASGQAIGHIFVCAAGNNNGQNIDTFGFYPASFALSNMITVAATTNEDLRAGFSNFGPNKCHLGAPGNNVYSTWSGSGYAYDSGTSMATPHVAGAVAMVYALNPSFTYQQVKYRILSTVRPVPALAGITVTGGVLNLAEAVQPGLTQAGTPYCSGAIGDPSVSTPCPCANPGAPGMGCKNSSVAAGARLLSSGVPALDNVVFTAVGELATSTSIVVQGDLNVPGGVVFGDGILCVSGNLKRLYTETAVNGSFSAPTGAEPSVLTQSALLGDVILPGSTRYYQVYYRDSNLVFCSPGYNATNAEQINW